MLWLPEDLFRFWVGAYHLSGLRGRGLLDPGPMFSCFRSLFGGFGEALLVEIDLPGVNKGAEAPVFGCVLPDFSCFIHVDGFGVFSYVVLTIGEWNEDAFLFVVIKGDFRVAHQISIQNGCVGDCYGACHFVAFAA